MKLRNPIKLVVTSEGIKALKAIKEEYVKKKKLLEIETPRKFVETTPKVAPFSILTKMGSRISRNGDTGSARTIKTRATETPRLIRDSS